MTLEIIKHMYTFNNLTTTADIIARSSKLLNRT